MKPSRRSFLFGLGAALLGAALAPDVGAWQRRGAPASGGGGGGFLTPNVSGMSTFATTGSISSGTRTLVVADSSGFAVNDYIIIATGGESGGGAPGTTGVGGSQAASDPLSDQHYDNTAHPRALLSRVSGKAGTTLTLSGSFPAASTGSTGANVYFDNYYIAEAAMNGVSASGFITWPSGSFAVGKRLVGEMTADNVTISGQGSGVTGSTTARTPGAIGTELFSPKGCSSFGIDIANVDDCEVMDFAIRGNAGVTGYGLDDGSGNFLCPPGLWFSGDCNDCEVHHFVAIDSFQKGIGIDGGSGIFIHHCETYGTGPLLNYVQWMVQLYAHDSGVVEDCYCFCTKLNKAFESIVSPSTVFNRNFCRNMICSNNTTGGVVWTDTTIVLEADSYYNADSVHYAEPMMNCNGHFDPGNTVLMAFGVKWYNLTLIQEDYLSPVLDIFKGMDITSNYTGFTWIVAGSSYTAPDGDYTFSPPSSGPRAITAEGSEGCYVQDFTHVGTNPSSNTAISIAHGKTRRVTAEADINIADTLGSFPVGFPP